jgi:cell wall-associated NlpC family hydrolase
MRFVSRIPFGFALPLAFVLALAFAGCQSSVRFASTWPYRPAEPASPANTEESNSVAENATKNNSHPKSKARKTTAAVERLPLLATAAPIFPTTEPTRLSEQQRTAHSVAQGWLGTPYHYGASSRSGTDCSGFTLRVYEEIGILLPRSSYEQFELGRAVAPSELTTGDLVFFNTSGSGVSHVGLYIGRGEMIHASSQYGVIVQSLNDPYYTRTFVGAKRILSSL